MAAAAAGRAPAGLGAQANSGGNQDAPMPNFLPPYVIAVPITTPGVFSAPLAAAAPAAAGKGANGNTPLPQPPVDITSGTGLPSAFRAAVVPRGPPMLAATAMAALPEYLTVLIPVMQKALWHACRNLRANRGGAAQRIVVLQPLPISMGVAIVDWFAQRYPSRLRSGGAAGKATVERCGKRMVYSVLLSPEQARDLCSFEVIANQGLGFGHMLILSSQGDVRFVRAVVVRFVHNMVQDARHSISRLELLLATWELNGFSGAMFTGPQLPYTQSQWAQCVAEAKKTLHAWPQEARQQHISPNVIAWLRARAIVPAPQIGMGARRLMVKDLTVR